MEGQNSFPWQDQGIEEVLDENVIHEWALRSREARAEIARLDFNEFVQFVVRDEITGKLVRQGWAHERWAEIINANKRAIIISHVEAGKTASLALARSLFELGRNPRLRIAILSDTQSQAKKTVAGIGRYITKSPELKYVYPTLRPGGKWTETSIVVARDSNIRSPSIQAFGYHGAMMGDRVDLLLVDDLLDEENTMTVEQRDKLEHWFWTTPMSRLTDKGRVIIIGNPWHPDDLLHRLEAQGWPTYRFPVQVTPHLQRHYPELKVGTPTWPEKFPPERIEHLRENTPPIEFARAYLCVARSDEDARFREEWIQNCIALGDGLELKESLYDLVVERHGADSEEAKEIAVQQVVEALEGMGDPDAHLDVRTFTGVDLSTGKAKDLTCLFTFAVARDGTRRVLDVQAGRWQVHDIVAKIVDVNSRYGSIVAVENNQAQDYVYQLVSRQTSIPIIPFTTGRNKAHPEEGIDLLALEMRNGKWIIPSKNGKPTDPEVEAWVEEMLYFHPKEHTGDRLMACWIGQQIARRFERRQQGDGNVMVI